MIKVTVGMVYILSFLLLFLGCGCPFDEPVGPGPTPVASPEDALKLAEKFCPVIYLNAEGDNVENFQPDAVQLMVDLSLIRDLNNPAFAEKPTINSLLQWFQSEYYLDVPDLNPQSASVAQYKAAYDVAKGSYKPTVYARVVDAGEYTVVQYWLFYYLNDWRNVHEGDWELVQLHFPKSPVQDLLQAGTSPVFAAYSQHQSGQRMSWSDMVAQGLVRETHPIVYVARGSHANYFLPGQYWAGLDFDDTGLSGWREIGSDQLDIILLQELADEPEGLQWLGFRGYWGEYVGFSISILELRFRQHGPFGPQWGDNGQIGKKWQRLEEWAVELPEYPNPFWTSFLKLPGDWSKLATFHLFSPAELHVYDAQGRHVGLDEEGRLETAIPEAIYIQPEGTDYKIILVPDADVADEYRIVVRGTDTGTMDIRAQVPDIRTELRKFLEYIGVPVSRSLVARAVIKPELAEMAPAVSPPSFAAIRGETVRDVGTELEIDNDGDGVFDIKTRPGRFVREAVTEIAPSGPVQVPEKIDRSNRE